MHIQEVIALRAGVELRLYTTDNNTLIPANHYIPDRYEGQRLILETMVVERAVGSNYMRQVLCTKSGEPIWEHPR